MPIDVLIARWVAVFWIFMGLSHLLQAKGWATLLMPLKDRENGGLILASFSLPCGLLIILGHNIWVWGLPVIVTIAGWLTTIKSVTYLVFPQAHKRVMSLNAQPESGFRIVGAVMIVLGALVGYDAFFRR